MNQIFFDMTTAIAEIQSQGIPDFITTALNGGTAYSYGQYAVVRYSGDNYISLVAANTALPSDATKWAPLPNPARLQQAAYMSAVAGGTVDAITAAFAPAIAALPAAPGTLSVFVRATGANATTTPTFKADGTPAKTIVKGANQALVAGDIAGAGHWLELQYDATLDKWVLQNPAFSPGQSASASIQGAFKNLAVSSTGLNANVTVTADEIAVEDSGNNYKTIRAVALTIAGTSVGANALDVGAIAASTWYSVWAIYNPTTQTTAGLLSLSATAPTLPSGYTYKARIGWIRTDGTANKYPLGFIQSGRKVQYKVASGTNVAALPQMAITTTNLPSAWTAIATGNFVPPTASTIRGVTVGVTTTNTPAYQVAPNNQYSTSLNSTTNPAPIQTNGGSVNPFMQFDFVLESTNIYWNGTPSGTYTAAVYAFGWEDKI